MVKANSLWSQWPLRKFGAAFGRYMPRMKVKGLKAVWVRVKVIVRVGFVDARGIARASAFKIHIGKAVLYQVQVSRKFLIKVSGAW